MEFNLEFDIDVEGIANEIKSRIRDILEEDYGISTYSLSHDNESLFNDIFLAVAIELIKNNPKYIMLLKDNEEEKIKNIFESDHFIIKM